MPIRRAVATTPLAISPRLATRTAVNTPGTLQAPGQPPSRDLAQRGYHRGVVAALILPHPVQRRRRALALGRRTHQVVERVRGPDDHAVEWRHGLMAGGGPALAANQ